MLAWKKIHLALPIVWKINNIARFVCAFYEVKKNLCWQMMQLFCVIILSYY